MTTPASPRAASRRSMLTLLWAIPIYWLYVFPTALRELRRWREKAASIPDPELRRMALAKLRDEQASAEGAAAFAILAARRHRLTVARACIAFEVLYDYLDALGEALPTVENNRQLHLALSDAVDRDRPTGHYYKHHPQNDDGGYAISLVAACRLQLSHLPRTASVDAELLAIAARASEAQSLNHGEHAGLHGLKAWASRQVVDLPGLRWFELAAGAGSPLGVFALIAAAAHATTTELHARTTAAAYFPWVAALHWLMESVVDHADDARTGNPSYVSHYGTRDEASHRLAAIAARSAHDIASLEQPRRHLLLLSGMVALNLVHEDAGHPLGHDVAATVRRSIGAMITPFLLMLRVRKAIKRITRLWSRARPSAAE